MIRKGSQRKRARTLAVSPRDQEAADAEEEARKVLVRGCDGDFESEEALRSAFSQFGRVTAVKLRRRTKAEGGSWGVVTLENATATTAALRGKDSLPTPLTIEAWSANQAARPFSG